MRAAAEELDLRPRHRRDRARCRQGSATAARRAPPPRRARRRATSRSSHCRRGGICSPSRRVLSRPCRRFPDPSNQVRGASRRSRRSPTTTARGHVVAAESSAAVAKVHRLARPGRGAGRRDRPTHRAAAKRHLGLDRRPAARIPHPPADDLHDLRITQPRSPCPRHRGPPPASPAAARSAARRRAGRVRALRRG